MSDRDLPGFDQPKTGQQGANRKFSEILKSLCDDQTRDRISVGNILEAMGDRAFGALMFIFALPNVFPTPPGFSAILGVPLVLLAAQLMLARQPWLPKLVASRSVRQKDFAKVMGRTIPWLAKAEKLLRPRLSWITVPPAENAIGALCLILAIILMLPIPLGNILPALAICLFSFGILERDGLWVIAGAAIFALSLVIVGGVLFALLKGAIFIITNLFH